MKRRRKIKRVKFTDAQVTAVIVRFLEGESRAELAEDFGVKLETIRDWTDGTTRHRCLIAAEKEYRRFHMGDIAKCAVCKCEAKLEVKSAEWRAAHPTDDSVFLTCAKECQGVFKGTKAGNIIEEWNETQRVLLINEDAHRELDAD